VNEPLQTTLADAASFLRIEGIPYALIGGLATSIRGEPRLTADVDLVIDAEIDRALALVGSLPQSPFRPLFEDVYDVITRAFLLPLRHRSTNIKVDIAIGLSGFERQTVARAEAIEIAGCMVPVARAEDLLIMKVLAGRPQDAQDVQGLVIAQGDSLDWDYCLRVASDLGEAIGHDLAARVSELRSST
jgi:hypothetical protein